MVSEELKKKRFFGQPENRIRLRQMIGAVRHITSDRAYARPHIIPTVPSISLSSLSATMLLAPLSSQSSTAASSTSDSLLGAHAPSQVRGSQKCSQSCISSASLKNFSTSASRSAKKLHDDISEISIRTSRTAQKSISISNSSSSENNNNTPSTRNGPSSLKVLSKSNVKSNAVRTITRASRSSSTSSVPYSPRPIHDTSSNNDLKNSSKPTSGRTSCSRKTGHRILSVIDGRGTKGPHPADSIELVNVDTLDTKRRQIQNTMDEGQTFEQEKRSAHPDVAYFHRYGLALKEAEAMVLLRAQEVEKREDMAKELELKLRERIVSVEKEEEEIKQQLLFIEEAGNALKERERAMERKAMEISNQECKLKAQYANKVADLDATVAKVHIKGEIDANKLQLEVNGYKKQIIALEGEVQRVAKLADEINDYKVRNGKLHEINMVIEERLKQQEELNRKMSATSTTLTTDTATTATSTQNVSSSTTPSPATGRLLDELWGKDKIADEEVREHLEMQLIAAKGKHQYTVNQLNQAMSKIQILMTQLQQLQKDKYHPGSSVDAIALVVTPVKYNNSTVSKGTNGTVLPTLERNDSIIYESGEPISVLSPTSSLFPHGFGGKVATLGKGGQKSEREKQLEEDIENLQFQLYYGATKKDDEICKLRNELKMLSRASVATIPSASQLMGGKR